MATSRALLLLSLALALLAGASAKKPDACGAISDILDSGGYVTTPEALLCLRSFPYRPKLAHATIDSLVKTFNLYVYKNIAEDSPSRRLPSNVDIIGGLQDINATRYSCDFDFQVAIYRLINSLNDGHTVYYPACYGFNFYQAFPLVQVANPAGTENIVKVSPYLNLLQPQIVNATFYATGLDVSVYAGALVHTVNGLPATTYVKRFANRYIGTYKDLNGRINSALSHATVNGIYYGGIATLPAFAAPQTPFITFTVQRRDHPEIETLTLPYFSDGGGTFFENSTDYFQDFCLTFEPVLAPAPGPAASASGLGKKAPLAKSTLLKSVLAEPSLKFKNVTLPDKDLQYKVVTGVHPGRIPKATKSEKAQVYGVYLSYVSTYLLDDLITAVIVVPDFLGFFDDYYGWQSDVFNGLTLAKELGATRLIIDVQSNGGGYVALPPAFLQFLFPLIGAVEYPIQGAAPPLVQRLVTAANQLVTLTDAVNSFSQYNWFGQADVFHEPFTDPNSPTSYFFPIEKLKFGFHKANYSSLYTFADAFTAPFGIDGLVRPDGDTEPLFEGTQILILSDANCFSACAIFTYTAQEVAGIKIATVGGNFNKSASYAAGCAGYSYELDELLFNDIEFFGLQNDPDAPQPLPFQATVGYVPAQAFCQESNTIPADFVFKPADIRIPYTDKTIVNVVNLWAELATYFPPASDYVAPPAPAPYYY